MDENRRYYEKRRVGAHYAKKSWLYPAEAAIFDRYQPHIARARILDLGVGGGRTTPFLRELSSDYVGVDYSSGMIEQCRRRFPAANFQVSDARDLSAFADESFDFVLFSMNGIDAVGHEERLRILKEVQRILKAGGLFVFSSHNRSARIRKPWDMAHFDVSPFRDPVRFGRRSVSYPLGILNYFRNTRRNLIEDEYCIVVDQGDMYSLMHYRITPAAQRQQLQRLGFREIEAVGLDGRSLSPVEFETAEDQSIHYVCRREA